MKEIHDTESFILKARKIHGDEYDYSLTKYINSRTKIKIICPKHGVFEQTSVDHISKKAGCPICANNKLSDAEEFIEKAKKVHGDKYDYSLVEYKGNKKKIKIICSKHGIFEQTPNNHLKGQTCPKCSKKIVANRMEYSTEEFIEKAKKVHGDKYDYSKVKYKGCRSYVNIICSKHGVFTQLPYTHLQGQGCPSCAESHGERDVAKWLDDHNIKYERQKRFSSCKNIRTLPFDFWLPDYGIAIEFQGKQHYVPIRKWGGKEGFDLVKLRDSQKRLFCEESGMVEIEVKYNANIRTLLGTFFDIKS